MISAMAEDPFGVLFAGTYGAGIFRSTDNGISWIPVNTGLTNSIVMSLACSSDGTLYAGTEGSYLFRSVDNGDHWSRLTAGDATFVLSIAVASNGTVFIGTPHIGVFRSTDRGGTWQAPAGSWQDYNFRSLSIDSLGYVFAGGNNGAYRSSDKGINWTPMNNGLSGVRLTALTIDPKGQLFAGCNVGVFRSINGGAAWSPVATSLQNLDVYALAANPSGTVFAGTFNLGIASSSDGGTAWKLSNTGLTDKRVTSLLSSKSGRIYAGTRGGSIYISSDGGTAWNVAGSLTANEYSRSVGTGATNTVFAGTHYQRGVFRSSNNGATWALTTSVFNSMSYAVDKKGVIYAGSDGSVFRSTDDGITWTRSQVGAFSITSLAVNSSGSVFAGTDGGGIYRSTDDGQTWIAINNGLKSNVVFSMAVNSSDYLYAAAYGAGVHLSTDNGSTWNLTSPTSTTWSNFPYVRAVAINSSGYLFAGCNWGLIRSTDNGSTWTDLTAKFSNGTVQGIVANSIGEIFVAVWGEGVYRSTDNGDTWLIVNSGLGNIYMQLQTIALSPSGFLFLGTADGVYRSAQSTIPRYLGESLSDPRTVLLLHLNETVGSAVIDASSYANTMTALATVVQSGRFGRAKKFSFGGSLTVSHSATLNIGASDVTLEAWVNTRTPDNLWTVMTKWDGRKGFSWEVQSNGIVAFTVSNDAGNTRKLTGKRTIDDLKWHHLAIRRLGTQIAQYIDGALDVSIDVGGSVEDFSSTASLVMGSGAGNVQNFSLDEVRISSVARSLQEFGLQLPPKNVLVSLTGSAVNLSWTNGGGAVGALRYKIYRGLDSTLVILRDSTTSPAYSDLGLAAATQYYYAVSAVDSTGFESGKSGVVSVTTQSASGPIVATLSVSSVTSGSATLNGSVNPSGQSTTAWFEWGTSATFATYNQTTAQSVGSGISAATFSADLAGLVQSTTYYFRSVAQNAGGVQKGGLATFTTTKAATGPSQKAMRFSGSGDYVEIPHSDSLVPSKMTIEVWIRVNAVPQGQIPGHNQNILDKRGSVAGVLGGYELRIPDQAVPMPLMLVLPLGGTEQQLSFPNVFQLLRWYHIAITHNGSFASLYVDGQFVSSQASTLSTSSKEPLRFGEIPYYPLITMALADIDEVRIWNYVRSATQIKDNMNKLLFGDESGLVGYWPFDADAGTSVADRSRTGNNGLRYGNALTVDSDLSFAPAMKLVSPTNGASTIPLVTTLAWNATPGVSRYRLEVSKSAFFTSYVLQDSSLTTKNRQIGPLQDSTTYYWRVIATTTTGEEVKTDVWSFTTVPAYKSTVAISTSLGFISKSKASDFSATDYRLFGLPGASDLALNSVLNGTQNVDWQAYWDNGASSNYMIPYDGSSNFKFSVGRGFWLISMRPISVDRVVATAPLNSDQELIVPLRSGWNIITNPFTSSIQWSKIQSVNGIAAPLYAFDGAFKSSLSFDPYVGYYLFNGSPNSTLSGLRVPYSSIFTKLDQPVIAGSKGWRLHVRVTAGSEVIKGVEIGVEPDSRAGLDSYDERIPRGAGKGSAILLQREEWDKDYPSFGTDIRPGINGVERWNMTLERSQYEGARSQNVLIHVDGIERIPTQYDVYLLDIDGKREQDLRKNQTYEFESRGTIREFSVIVGEPTLVRSEAEKNLPTEIKVGPNYPNPFNPETIIPIELPKTMDVKIVVYDILGRAVKTLYDRMMESGRHYVRWNGRDEQQRKLASGVYLFRVEVTAGKKIVSGKITLVQ
ncbi:MAG: T9SS type A sorting domain-containing protein [Ignavibacteriales bacterium]|nr:T9SS type A sorting domain-containing protein [Ignavibacteriales bacterium]